jgi:hypothetical protein
MHPIYATLLRITPSCQVLRAAEPACDSAHPRRMEGAIGWCGVTKEGMTNRPSSATNFKASNSTLPSYSAPETSPGCQKRGSSDNADGGAIPCLLLDCYKSDPARVDRRSLEDSDLSPLAKMEGNPSGTGRALRPWICSW